MYDKEIVLTSNIMILSKGLIKKDQSFSQRSAIGMDFQLNELK